MSAPAATAGSPAATAGSPAGSLAGSLAGSPAALAGLGTRLRALGLSERAVTACFGVSCVAHAPLRARAMYGLERPPPPPAALLAHLFVAGLAVPEADLRRRLGDDLDLLAALELIEHTRAGVAATVAILPVGEALVVSDRADRLRGRDVVALADDSAFHTRGAVPARARRPAVRWLDVGTGSGIVPLARPGAAAAVRATDVHARAVAMAELGAALSGRRNMAVAVADLLDGADRHGPWDLITFNAPIPRAVLDGGAEAPLYRQSDTDLAARFWTEVRPLVAAGGEVILHSWQPAEEYPASLALPGRVTAVRYTPPEAAIAFGVTAWQPDAAPACRLLQVTLGTHAPHVTRAMLQADA